MLSVRHLQDRVESLVNELTKSVKGISLDHVCSEYNRMYGTTLEADLAVIGHNVALFLKPRENFGFTLLKESRPLIFLPNDFGKQLKAHFEAWDGDLRSALAAAPFQGAGDAPLIFNKSGFNADEFNRAYDILEVEKAKKFFEMPPENQDNFPEWREVTNLHDLLYFLQAVDEERPEGFPPEELQSICDDLCTGFFDFSRYNLKRPHKDLTRLEMLRKKLGQNEKKVFKVSSKVMKLKFFPMEEENSSQLFVMLRQTKHHRVPIEQFIQKMMDRDNEHDVEKASAKLGEVLDEFSMYFKLSPGFISLRPEVPIDYVIPAFE